MTTRSHKPMLLCFCLLLMVCFFSMPLEARPILSNDRAEANDRRVNFDIDLKAIDSVNVTEKDLRHALDYLKRFGYLVQPVRSSAPSTNLSALFKEAVTRFQRIYQLSITGQLDSSTLAAMREGRCGLADDVQRDNNNKRTVEVNRHRRSLLYRMLPRNVGRRFSKRHLSWQLGPTGPRLSRHRVTDLVHRAFGLWASVTPFRFRQELDGFKRADIRVGFYRRSDGDHRFCNHSFDGPGGDAAHTQTANQIHIDLEESFEVWQDRPVTGRRVHLLRLLVHEIGHLLGLQHSPDRSSIMHPSSVNQWPAPGLPRDSPLIGETEAELVRQRYGPCSPRIDAIIDWSYGGEASGGGGVGGIGGHLLEQRDFSSVRVVSCGSVWTGQLGGYPDSLRRVWPGLKQLRGIDAILQAETPDGRRLLSLAFSGSKYYQLNSATGELIGQPGDISVDFGTQLGSSVGFPALPLDAAYYDYDRQLAVFIKGSWAYEYDLMFPNATMRKRNCCGRHVKLGEMFPAAVEDTEKPLAMPVDAAYYRRSDSTVFLISGTEFWYFGGPANQTVDTAAAAEAVKEVGEQPKVLRYGGKVYQQWKNLCSVADSTCDLNSVVKPK